MKNDSRNLLKEKRNVTDWHINDSKSSWFSQSQEYDQEQNSRRRMWENKE